MSDAEIESFADFIHDAAIQYANGHETDFRPVARRIAEASRRAALEEACEVIMQPANMSYFWGEVTGADHCAEEIAKHIRSLSGPTET